ncbi:MAG: hypothetical protein KC620_19210 [Myxococcales bacterium]|nr:hypothetical protein [Myxococcales bacterium]
MTDRRAFGDFQTPPALARAVCRRLASLGLTPGAVVEPTCGVGGFLAAAATAFASATLLGVEIDPGHAEAARQAAPSARVEVGDFFTTDWPDRLAALPGPVLVLGNPPWVTAAEQGALGAKNRPPRGNLLGYVGLDALTGASNFDISEWMLLRLIDALAPSPDGVLAMLVKTHAARRALTRIWREGPPLAEARLYRIDARRHFGATVDAGLLICRTGPAGPPHCAVYADLDAPQPAVTFGLIDDALVADVDAYAFARPILGKGPRWRSGVKHDCAAVLELTEDGDGLRNGLGERVDVEPAALWPLMKSTDVAHGRPVTRRLLLTQRRADESPEWLATEAPRAWQYLQAHARQLARRRSAIYRKRPPFAVFGVGPYSFSPWKIALSALARAPAFRAIGPCLDRPVLFDDTVYLLPCADGDEARRFARLLASDRAVAALQALAFSDAKRPLTAAILGRIDLEALEKNPLR